MRQAVNNPWDSGHRRYLSQASLAALCRGPQWSQDWTRQCLRLSTFTAPSQAASGKHEARTWGSPTFLAASSCVPGAAPPLPGGHCLVHHLVCGSHHGSVAERMRTGPLLFLPLCGPQGLLSAPWPRWSLSCILGFNPSIPSQPSSLGDLDTNGTGSPYMWSLLSLAVTAP